MGFVSRLTSSKCIGTWDFSFLFVETGSHVTRAEPGFAMQLGGWGGVGPSGLSAPRPPKHFTDQGPAPTSAAELWIL